MKIGILGAGKIAHVMADTIVRMKDPQITLQAIGARDKKRAEEFAGLYDIPAAYGSYEELVCDAQIDLIYIATPHSHHFAHAKLCLQHHKAVLCEKSFCANAVQSKELLQLAKENNVFISEAIWTRYMPSRAMLTKLLKKGCIGKLHSLQANLGYPLQDVERMREPSLAGGALLDVGVYTLNFAAMLFGEDICDVQAHAVLSKEGVDLTDSITLFWEDGKSAVLHATMLTPTDRTGYIYGEDGYLAVININNPQRIEQYDRDHQLIAVYEVPKQISGYEYELLACQKALQNGQIECEEMPHASTLRIMELMDSIRAQWSLRFPFEKSE